MTTWMRRKGGEERSGGKGEEFGYKHTVRKEAVVYVHEGQGRERRDRASVQEQNGASRLYWVEFLKGER